jgi:hypothetical protein
MSTMRNPWRWGQPYATTPPAAANTPPPETQPGEPQPQPWDRFTTHTQIDDYTVEEKIRWPEGWSAMTIARKKEWLDGTVR